MAFSIVETMTFKSIFRPHPLKIVFFVEPTGGEGRLRDPFGVRPSVRP